MCYSSRTSRSWQIAHSTQRPQRSCNNIPFLLQRTAPIACSFCEGCIWHGFHTVLLQPLRWCCVDCVIIHERDVREEQKYMHVTRTSNNRDHSIIACCHGAKLCAHAARDFRSQQAIVEITCHDHSIIACASRIFGCCSWRTSRSW